MGRPASVGWAIQDSNLCRYRLSPAVMCSLDRAEVSGGSRESRGRGPARFRTVTGAWCLPLIPALGDNSEMADDTEEARRRRLSLEALSVPRASAPANWDYFFAKHLPAIQAAEEERRRRAAEEKMYLEARRHFQEVNGNLFFYRRLRWYESKRFWLAVVVLLIVMGGAVWLAVN